MRINTDGKKAWRNDLYKRTAANFEENTKSGGIDSACVFANEMLSNLEEALEHDDMTEDLAEILSTRSVQLEYRRETDLRIE